MNVSLCNFSLLYGLLYGGHESFDHSVGLGPHGCDYPVFEVQVSCELRELMSIKWWAIVRLHYCGDSPCGERFINDGYDSGGSCGRDLLRDGEPGVLIHDDNDVLS